jgi:hypothetical protein
MIPMAARGAAPSTRKTFLVENVLAAALSRMLYFFSYNIEERSEQGVLSR